MKWLSDLIWVVWNIELILSYRNELNVFYKMLGVASVYFSTNIYAMNIKYYENIQ